MKRAVYSNDAHYVERAADSVRKHAEKTRATLEETVDKVRKQKKDPDLAFLDQVRAGFGR
jgi:hypothetical protein